MTPQEFIQKWGPGGPAYGLSERAGAQPHFMDLCQVLGVPTPGDADNYCFERGVTKTGTGQGFADVWMRNHFGWEYKAPGKSLEGALKQLMQYALPLDSPPLLVVSDRLRIEIHTHFTGTPSEKHVILLEDLPRPDAQEKLRWLFKSPERFKPTKTNQQITEEAASAFAGTAERLRGAGVPPEQVSHFLTQCLFCFFAEDVGLLPARLFERLVGVNVSPAKLQAQLEKLFESMRDGGLFGVDDIPWFNGGLFQNIKVPALSIQDVKALQVASGLNWSAIDPSIFGTLFERGLDPNKRSQLGAHYTDPATILRIVEPVVQRPLLDEWGRVYATIAALLSKRDSLRESAKTIVDKTKFARVRTQANEAEREAQKLFNGYLEKLKEFKVLDPACGSGNFLYLALKTLKDVEHRVNLDAETLGLQRQHDVTGPHNVRGLEINEFAAELARVTVWIGELQWRIQHGYAFRTNPVLEPLDCIEHRDALMNDDGTEMMWPNVSVVVGNPPFVGDKKMRAELGDAYTEALRKLFKGRVRGAADLVCYWFEKARAQIEQAGLGAAGLVATNSIRQGANRVVLSRVLGTTRIFEAWSDEPWVNEGANLRVSLVAFGNSVQNARLDGVEVDRIYADLTAGKDGDETLDLTSAQSLAENDDATFFGFCLAGPFLVEPAVARQWLLQPNASGRSNAEVLKPIFNGADLRGRSVGRWAIDFGATMSEDEASLFELPFEYAVKNVLPVRQSNRRGSRAKWWFRHGETRPGLRAAIDGLSRMIVTIETSKHRFFAWLPTSVAPEHKLVVIPREDDATFGILSSRIHVVWVLRKGSTLEDRPVYTTGEVFGKFPFPAGITPRDTSNRATEPLASGALIPAGLAPAVRGHATAIAEAAKRLNELREEWLNPPAWTVRTPEVTPVGVSGAVYPARIAAKPGFESELGERTMTDLYSRRPTWLVKAHEQLDAAVAAAYGWTDYTPATSDEEILRRLLALNKLRATGE